MISIEFFKNERDLDRSNDYPSMIGGEKDQLAQFLLSPAPPLSPLAFFGQFKG